MGYQDSMDREGKVEGGISIVCIMLRHKFRKNKCVRCDKRKKAGGKIDEVSK